MWPRLLLAGFTVFEYKFGYFFVTALMPKRSEKYTFFSEFGLTFIYKICYILTVAEIGDEKGKPRRKLRRAKPRDLNDKVRG